MQAIHRLAARLRAGHSSDRRVRRMTSSVIDSRRRTYYAGRMPQSPRAVGFKVDREPRRVVTFRLDVDLIEAMNDLRDREGIQPSEQARRAIREWLVRKRVTGKPERKRAATRRRS